MSHRVCMETDFSKVLLHANRKTFLHSIQWLCHVIKSSQYIMREIFTRKENMVDKDFATLQHRLDIVSHYRITVHDKAFKVYLQNHKNTHTIFEGEN